MVASLYPDDSDLSANLGPEEFATFKKKIEEEMFEALKRGYQEMTWSALTSFMDARLIAAFRIDMQPIILSAMKDVTKELESGIKGNH